MTPSDDKKNPGTRLEDLRRKREEVKASGFKAPDAETPRRGQGGGLGGCGGKLRDLLGKRQQGKGETAVDRGAGGKGQLLKRLMEARKTGGDNADVKSVLQRMRGGDQAGGARLGGGDNQTLEDRRARLQRFIERLQKD